MARDSPTASRRLTRTGGQGEKKTALGSGGVGKVSRFLTRLPARLPGECYRHFAFRRLQPGLGSSPRRPSGRTRRGEGGGEQGEASGASQARSHEEECHGSPRRDPEHRGDPKLLPNLLAHRRAEAEQTGCARADLRLGHSAWAKAVVLPSAISSDDKSPRQRSLQVLWPVPDFGGSISGQKLHLHDGILTFGLEDNRCSWLNCLGVQFNLL